MSESHVVFPVLVLFSCPRTRISPSQDSRTPAGLPQRQHHRKVKNISQVIRRVTKLIYAPGSEENLAPVCVCSTASALTCPSRSKPLASLSWAMADVTQLWQMRKDSAYIHLTLEQHRFEVLGSIYMQIFLIDLHCSNLNRSRSTVYVAVKKWGVMTKGRPGRKWTSRLSHTGWGVLGHTPPLSGPSFPHVRIHHFLILICLSLLISASA